MTSVEWWLDPITMTDLENPYLASDGITYSLSALQQAMAADEWHRSPVTQQVLRPLAYPNSIVAKLLRQHVADEPETLFDSHTPMPISGELLTRTLPVLSSPTTAKLKHKWKLEEATEITLQVRILRDTAQSDWLMHPPPAEEMWDDCLELAKSFNLHKLVQNPWCLSTALLNGLQVETLWIT